MEPGRSYYYDINKKLLMVIGQWPYQKPKDRMIAFAFTMVLAVFAFFPQIKDLTDRLFVDWEMLQTKEEHDIMRKYAETGRWYALIYCSFIYVGTVIFATTALVPRILDVLFPLNTSRPVMLPYPAYYFVDENQYFYYIFCHELFTGCIGMTGLIAHDTTFFVYVEHVCGLFAIVGFRFEHVSHKRSTMEKNMLNHPDAVYHKNIVISIYAHHKALQ
ncbi:uncharacterized protein LOC112460034 isoform X2 [Temnothorax curvispinosus]|uniref:Uncharacterized protein LOC112460034 isoform X2 n=1 Tax=Temnothorax curvispinosus TaxID=300111 RepID=A0A6J1QD30_9HYME|nr:uncharacterized protein LOC112460034 isoform X2 [Temnothorax curvispinosus]